MNIGRGMRRRGRRGGEGKIRRNGRRGVLGRGEEEQDRRVILGRIEEWEIDQKNR